MVQVADARYGKAAIEVARLVDGRLDVLEVVVAIAGEAFVDAFVHGDNRSVVPTDTLKNVVHHEIGQQRSTAVADTGIGLAERLLARYPDIERVQVEIVRREAPRAASHVPTGMYFLDGPASGCAFAAVDHACGSEPPSVRAGRRGWRVFRPTGNSFAGFARDEHTTLAEESDRPLALVLDVSWTVDARSRPDRAAEDVEDRWLASAFACTDNHSVQDLLHRVGSRLLAEWDHVSDVELRAENRAWQAVADDEQTGRTYRPLHSPPGVIELRLVR
jgi:urate oxidase